MRFERYLDNCDHNIWFGISKDTRHGKNNGHKDHDFDLADAHERAQLSALFLHEKVSNAAKK